MMIPVVAHAATNTGHIIYAVPFTPGTRIFAFPKKRTKKVNIINMIKRQLRVVATVAANKTFK